MQRGNRVLVGCVKLAVARESIKNILPVLIPGSEYKCANPNEHRAANLSGLAIAIVLWAKRGKASKIKRRIWFTLWVNERKKAEKYKWRKAERNYKRDPHTYAKPEAKWIESSRQRTQNWLKRSLFDDNVDWYGLHRLIFHELSPSPDHNCEWWRKIKDICEDPIDFDPVDEILKISNEYDKLPTSTKQNQQKQQEVGDGSLEVRYEKAYQSYCYAVGKNTSIETDKQAYDWLKENGCEDEDYQLPSFETWQRYVQSGRKFHGTQKNKPRGGRTGRSIVRSKDL